MRSNLDKPPLHTCPSVLSSYPKLSNGCISRPPLRLPLPPAAQPPWSLLSLQPWALPALVLPEATTCTACCPASRPATFPSRAARTTMLPPAGQAASPGAAPGRPGVAPSPPRCAALPGAGATFHFKFLWASSSTDWSRFPHLSNQEPNKAAVRLTGENMPKVPGTWQGDSLINQAG